MASSGTPLGASASAAALQKELDAGKSLLRALLTVTSRPLSLSAGLFIVQVGCSLATPIIINQLLKWVIASNPSPGPGIGYVFALAAASVGGFMAEHEVETISKARAGATCRAAAASLVYEKVLRTSVVDAQRTHSGELTNVFSGDAGSLTALPHGLVVMVLQPLEIAGVVGLLAWFVEWGALGALSVVIAAIVILQFSGHRLEGLLARRGRVTDTRVRDTLEMLSGMRAVKLGALEAKFVAAIAGHRAAESGLARRTRWWYGAVNTTSSNSVDVISLAVLLVLTLGMRVPLTPDMVFTFWVLLSLLHARIFSYPVALKQVRDGLAAVARIQAFLGRPERTDTRLLLPEVPTRGAAAVEGEGSAPTRGAADDSALQPPTYPAVSIRHGYFSWVLRPDAPVTPTGGASDALVPAPVVAEPLAAAPASCARCPAEALRRACLLQGISLSLRAGQLGCVVGPVGSGKSSLLAALLGEMDAVAAHTGSNSGDGTGATGREVRGEGSDAAHPADGSPSGVALATGGGPVGYVPQTAFILSGTVRDNITLGRPWDAARYEAVVEACALGPDFASWPRGDLARVGAFTLSGGQKQRISIARAAYGVCAVYLFDDCLSALDARVGRHVLERCILGLLGSATRVLVTSSGAALRHADAVGVMVPLRWVARQAQGGPSPAVRALAVCEPPLLRGLPPTSPPLGPSPTRAGRSGAVEPLAGILGDAPLAPTPGASANGRSGKGEAGPFTLLWGDREAMTSDPVVAPLLAVLVGRGNGASVDGLAPLPSAQRPQGSDASSGSGPESGGGSGESARADDITAPTPHPTARDGESPGALSRAPRDAAVRSNAGLPAVLGVGPTPREAVPFLQEDQVHPPQPLMPPPPVDTSAAPLTTPAPDGGNSDAAAAVEPRLRRLALPFFRSWMLGAGGPRYGWGALALLAAEATWVQVSVYWLAWWSEDPTFERYAFTTYLWGYALFVGLELASAYTRQHVYVLGVTAANDGLHDAILRRLGSAPQWYFDSHSAGSLLDLLGRDLAHLDSDAFYASEYFWLGLIYGVLIVIVECVVTPWVLLPGAVCAGIMWAVIRESGTDDGDAGNGELSEGAVAIGDLTLAASPVAASESSGAALVGNMAPPDPGSPSAATAPPSSACAPSRGPRGPRPSVSSLLTSENAASVPVLEHFTASLEGLPSLRAFHAQGRFLATHHALTDAHAVAWAAVASAEARQVLLGNLAGALFYIVSVAIIVPLRTTGDAPISGGDAGFIVVNSAFASYMATMVLMQRGALADLALTRGSLVAALCEMPREATTGGGPAEEAALAAADARYRPHYDAMMRADALKRQRAQALRQPSQGAVVTSKAFVSPVGNIISSTAALFARPFRRGGDSKEAPEGTELAGVTAPPEPIDAPAGWPARGHIVVRDLQLRYRPHLPLVLRGVSLDIPPGANVVVIGRTGAGKSSLVAALTRLAEPEPGSVILIDGVDATRLPLSTLRRGLVVVSQDALFFSGTLRRNLDPFREHSDEELLQALRRVRLHEFASAQATAQAGAAAGGTREGGAAAASSNPLDMVVTERGGNLSAGQQQLLALVRALLRRPRLLLLDEATASLDVESEEVVAETIATAFPGATLIQIAHRLIACARADTVVVMSEGRVGEVGSPLGLLSGAEGSGLFASLVGSLPPSQRERLVAAAEAAAAARFGAPSSHPAGRTC